MPFPSKIIAGDTTVFDLPEAEFIQADGWVMKVQIRAKTEVTLTGAWSAGVWSFSLSAAQSASLKTGDYRITSFVEKGVGAALERHSLNSQMVSVVDGLVADVLASQGLASRILEKIEAVLENRASHDVLSYEIRGRSLSRMDTIELIKWRSYWQKEVRKEEAQASGKSVGPRRYRMTLR